MKGDLINLVEIYNQRLADCGSPLRWSWSVSGDWSSEMRLSSLHKPVNKIQQEMEMEFKHRPKSAEWA